MADGAVARRYKRQAYGSLMATMHVGDHLALDLRRADAHPCVQGHIDGGSDLGHDQPYRPGFRLTPGAFSPAGFFGGVRLEARSAERVAGLFRGRHAADWYGEELGMVMARWARVLCGALSLMVVIGCSPLVTGDGSQPAGSADQVSRSVDRGVVPSSDVAPSRRVFADPDKLTARDALGDLALLNPCSLLDPDTLPDTWTVVIDVPVAFNFCEINVTTKEGAVVEAHVGKPQPAWSAPEDHPAGAREAGISIVPGRPGIRDGCGRDIVFADGIALEVNTIMDATMGSTDPCAVSDAIADHVVTTVLDGRAESLDFPEHSLGRLDACTLVGPDLLAAVPGLGADVQAQEWIAGHSCWWEDPDTRATLDLEFELGSLPTGTSGTTLHGRYTTTTRYADFGQYSSCEVSGEHVPFEYKDETTIRERVAIFVRLPAGQGEAACAAASAIANRLWPALPPL